MPGLKTKALAAFKEDVENKKATATRQFKKDFGIDPDEVTYQGNWQFLFRANGLHIRGYIEWFHTGYLYGKCYQLAAPCPCHDCEGLVIDEKTFYDLAGLGEAIHKHEQRECAVCASTWAD